MYYIGYDIGSSSVKAALVDTDTGKQIIVVNEPETEMEIIAHQPNWAEQDPNEWWKHVCNATKRAIKESGINASKISAIGISYQMHGLVVVDKDLNPLRNAIIWCDSRAVEIGEKAFIEIGKHKCATRLLNSPANFTASKLKWVRDNEPDVYNKIYKYMLPGDFIAMQFTGEVNTTKNGLSEGILWDFKNDELASFLLEHYNINEDLTPTIVSNFTSQGLVTKRASIASGLPVGIPINYRAGDQPNNALSLNVLKHGEVAATGGTSGVVYAVTNKLQSKETSRINHFAHVNYTQKKPVLGKLLNINGAGIQYRWLKDNLGVNSYDEMNKMASKISVGSNGLSLIPFGNGAERMFNNKTIGTHFCNLNLNKHTNAHLYRAALEGIAFSFAYGMQILKDDNTAINVIRAGNDNLFRSEIFSTTVATLIGFEIEIYNTTGAVGAARAAGVIDGDFTDFKNNSTANDLVKTYKPLEDKLSYVKAYEKWKYELETILKHK
ncbi:xylulokinase [Cellulophaga omnivescoria]|uniref:xylulokinase n=1 Tax=Cellulophaga omnivescoria TaxID=1888890 RepID=UPI0009851F85|nr:FGGY family carbohydrate kinase [Cellulophaga omnivescoria]